MALKGTIRDFGVADIFQLISQQVKTGVLVLSNDVDEVRVFFRDGSVVRAENSLRSEQLRLGNMLVRAHCIAESQLQEALDEQHRSLKRVGRVLQEMGYTTADTVREFATLQMTEAIYSLFEWKYGTYEFEAVPVEPSPDGIEPIRAESIVMNGIRMTDEWPGIRERIPYYGWQVEPMRPLPPRPIREGRSEDDELDFSALGGDSEYDDIGGYERRAYGLINPGSTVQDIIDHSRLGEFETCRALSTLMGAGYIRVIKPTEEREPSPPPKISRAERARRIAAVVGRVLSSAALVVIAVAILTQTPAYFGGEVSGSELTYEPQPLQDHYAKSQLRVLQRAIEVYRLNHGAYPSSLEKLVDAGLVRSGDLRFPFARDYFYKTEGPGFVLLPPVR